jgi:hypothetical protein
MSASGRVAIADLVAQSLEEPMAEAVAQAGTLAPTSTMIVIFGDHQMIAASLNRQDGDRAAWSMRTSASSSSV